VRLIRIGESNVDVAAEHKVSEDAPRLAALVGEVPGARPFEGGLVFQFARIRGHGEKR